jgi:hypothetical protein
MKRLIFVPVLLILLSRCASISYLGDKYPPTSHVDLFFSENDVPREYLVIGRMEATADADEIMYSTDKFTDAILKKAGEKGADAVVILDFGKVTTGVNESRDRTETTEETKRGGTVTHEHENVSHSVDEKRRVEALVLRYK